MKNILMNTEMAKAILDGRKVQTRRVIRFNDNFSLVDDGKKLYYDGEVYPPSTLMTFSKYKIGDTIWVREPMEITHTYLDKDKNELYIEGWYKADDKKGRAFASRLLKNNERPSWCYTGKSIPNGCIKEMARIFLKITDVRVERLQDISDSDIFKEGCGEAIIEKSEHKINYTYFRKQIENWWINLWNKTAPKGYKWEDNPYVFVYEFERVEK